MLPGQLAPLAQLTPLTVTSAATSWWLDPCSLALAGLLGGGYLFGVRTLRLRGGRWPWYREVMFVLGGAGSIVATGCSFLGVYAPVLRWVAVTQACLLLLVCPVLLGLGAPVALLQAVRTASPVQSEQGEQSSEQGEQPRPISRWVTAALRTLSRGPGIAPLVLLVVITLLMFTPWLGLSVQRTDVRVLTLVVLVAAGLLLALPITDHGIEVSSLAYAAMLALGLLEFLLDAVPGLVLRLSSHLLAAGHWVGVHPAWAPSPLADQRLAGDLLWFFAEAGDLPFLLLLVRAWIRADAREAALQDAALDLAEEQAPGGLMRPWWETEKPRRLG